MNTLIPLVGSIAILLIALDGIAYMIGRRNFPVIRLTLRLIRRMIGGTLIGAGKAIAGGGRSGGNRRR